MPTALNAIYQFRNICYAWELGRIGRYHHVSTKSYMPCFYVYISTGWEGMWIRVSPKGLKTCRIQMLQVESKPLPPNRFQSELGLSFANSHRMQGHMDHHGDDVGLCRYAKMFANVVSVMEIMMMKKTKKKKKKKKMMMIMMMMVMMIIMWFHKYTFKGKRENWMKSMWGNIAEKTRLASGETHWFTIWHGSPRGLFVVLCSWHLPISGTAGHPAPVSSSK